MTASDNKELSRLRAEVAALRQLIEVHETVSLEQAQKAERALADVEKHNQALVHAEGERLRLIERLTAAVEELTTPVLEVWDDVLALPVVGIVDTHRSGRMTEHLLSEVVRTGCKYVIIDLTGVELIDTSTADRFLKLAHNVELLGSECIITGIRPAVAQTLVELGVEFGKLATRRNLKEALKFCAEGLQRQQAATRR